MANLYEFEVTREVVETLVGDIGLSISTECRDDIVENLLSIVDRPTVFQKALMDGKPGFLIRVGTILTDRFEGEGLHMFTHFSSEGFLDTMEFDRRLKASLGKQEIPFIDRTYPKLAPD